MFVATTVRAGVGVPKVDELERRGVADPDHDGELGIGVKLRPVGLVARAGIEQRRRREMSDRHGAADPLGVADASFHPLRSPRHAASCWRSAATSRGSGADMS
jgi:hypothetical protein